MAFGAPLVPALAPLGQSGVRQIRVARSERFAAIDDLTPGPLEAYSVGSYRLRPLGGPELGSTVPVRSPRRRRPFPDAQERPMSLTLGAIERAHAFLKDRVRRTPVEESAELSR